MSKRSYQDVKPFISTMFIILTLFLIVVVKMEVRRVGYGMWKQARVEKNMRDEYYQTSVRLAQKLGPGRIHSYARSELEMHKAHFGQIIQMTHQQVALRQ